MANKTTSSLGKKTLHSSVEFTILFTFILLLCHHSSLFVLLPHFRPCDGTRILKYLHVCN